MLYIAILTSSIRADLVCVITNRKLTDSHTILL